MAKRAMSSEKASRVKLSGHGNEYHFAEAIGGDVNAGSHTDKKDVIDKQHRPHSVKAGEWWQVFLYSETRLRKNTIFQGLGDVANIMVDCLNAYPDDFLEYKKDKQRFKEALRPHMIRLLQELSKRVIFKAFLDKALFDGGNAYYLSVYLGVADTPEKQKHFHVFSKDDVTDALMNDITLANSKARNPSQTSEQKVVFKSTINNKQIGEIEDRHDSPQHYREMKFRLNAKGVMKILQKAYDHNKKMVFPQVTAYGEATKTLKK